MAVIGKTAEDNSFILVNSNLSFKEQNFHGCHELIHIYENDKSFGQTFTCYENVRPFQNSYIEWIANEGAAELLVPYRELLPLFKMNYSTMIRDLGSYNFCEVFSDSFLVSPAVLQNRIDSLKYEIHQYLNGTPIEKIQILSKKAQESKGIYIKSLFDLENDRISELCDTFNRPTNVFNPIFNNTITADIQPAI